VEILQTDVVTLTGVMDVMKTDIAGMKADIADMKQMLEGRYLSLHALRLSLFEPLS
jgi:hypothetical protein